MWVNYCIVAGNNPGSTSAGRDISSSTGWLTSLTGRNVYGGTPSWGASERMGNIVLTDNATGEVLVSLDLIMDHKLVDNGGTVRLPDGTYVKTHALFDNSYALDPVQSELGFQTTDQRGFNRDEMPDIGAFEYIPTTGTKVIKQLNGTLKVTSDAIECLENGKIEIISIAGLIVKKANISAGEKISTPTGIHLVKFSNENGITTIKIIR